MPIDDPGDDPTATRSGARPSGGSSARAGTSTVTTNDGEALLRAATGGARPRPKASSAKAAPVDNGQPGLTDRALTEARTTPERLGLGFGGLRATWEDAVRWVTSAGREGRAAIIALAIDQELDRGRRAHLEAKTISNEVRRADMITASNQFVVDGAAELDRAIADLWTAQDRVDRIARALAFRLTDAERVASPATWSAAWRGAAVGRGIPGYDTAQGIAEVAAEVRQAVEQRRAWAESDAGRKAQRAAAKEERGRDAGRGRGPASHSSAGGLFDGMGSNDGSDDGR